MGETLGECMKEYKKKQYFCIEYEGRYFPHGGNAYSEDAYGGDGILIPDNEGHCLSSGISNYCMSGHDVKVQINPKTSKENVIKLLDKIKNWMKNRDDWQNGGDERLKKIGNFSELQDMIQIVMLENYYTVEDIECMFDSIKLMRDKKIQAEKTPKDIVDDEMPF